MTSFQTILQKIIEQKLKNIETRKLKIDQLTIEDQAKNSSTPIRSFRNAIAVSIKKNGIAIISECKKASPSKGLLRPDYDLISIARDYEQHGAACISVLTEEDFFLGSDEHLIAVKQNTNIPILRKDFIIDPYQIYESRIIGADCILLIVAALSKMQLQDYYDLATSIGLEVLVEINNDDELATALSTPATFIGINNRNLNDFSVDIERTLAIAKNIPDDRIIICESGIRSKEDINQMYQHHIKVFLIGETLMKSAAPGETLQELLGATS